MRKITIGDRSVGDDEPTYFIADISANHDGDLERAKMLIRLAAQSGAEAAKFQNFRAPEIVSDYGFRSLGNQLSHQSIWSKSVFEVYQGAAIPFDWAPELSEECEEAGVHYFSSPYDFEAVNELEAFFPAIKIGSGDITWLEIIRLIASKGKPVILATGASTLEEVRRAADAILELNSELVLMQCNTNYTASPDSFDHIHLNVLKTYAELYPQVVLGLSDHTSGHATVLGAVALGASVIEKHFTDDINREGPDHLFSMDPDSWREMVDRTRELERALGSPEKKVASNETATVVIQRRCLRAAQNIEAGSTPTREMITVLRPAPEGAIEPHEIEDVVGSTALVDIPAHEALDWKMFRN